MTNYWKYQLFQNFQFLNSKKTVLGLFVLLLFLTKLSAQISGNVADEVSKSIPFTTVVLQKSQDSTIVAYTQTNENGFYYLVAP